MLAAAALYWRHFGGQILPLPTAHRQGVALLRAAMRPDHALVALSAQGRLIGIVGLRDGAGGLQRGQVLFVERWQPTRYVTLDFDCAGDRIRAVPAEGQASGWRPAADDPAFAAICGKGG